MLYISKDRAGQVGACRAIAVVLAEPVPHHGPHGGLRQARVCHSLRYTDWKTQEVEFYFQKLNH